MQKTYPYALIDIDEKNLEIITSESLLDLSVFYDKQYLSKTLVQNLAIKYDSSSWISFEWEKSLWLELLPQEKLPVEDPVILNSLHQIERDAILNGAVDQGEIRFQRKSRKKWFKKEPVLTEMVLVNNTVESLYLLLNKTFSESMETNNSISIYHRSPELLTKYNDLVSMLHQYKFKGGISC